MHQFHDSGWRCQVRGLQFIKYHEWNLSFLSHRLETLEILVAIIAISTWTLSLTFALKFPWTSQKIQLMPIWESTYFDNDIYIVVLENGA